MKPLTIGIDATLAGAKGAERSGIYRYLKQLLLGFRKAYGQHRFRLLFNSFRRQNLNGIPDFISDIGGSEVEVVISRFPGRLRQRFNLPVDWFTGPIDIFHGPSHLIPRIKHGRTVVTIHDLAFLRMTEIQTEVDPDWYNAIHKRSPNPKADLIACRARSKFFQELRGKVPETLARADAIIAVSEATARDLVEIANVPRSKIWIVLNGFTPGFMPVQDKMLIRKTLSNFNINDKYILYVGVLDPNKDLHSLIAGFAKTSADFRKKHKLVIAGPRNWFQPVLEEEADRLGVGNRVIFTGFVPDQELAVLYSEALVAVSPSPLEGFGFPVLEAMACGTPVIIADSCALPEIAGEAALRVPPGDPDALALAMEQIADDTNLSQNLIIKGFSQNKKFSWEQTAKKTLEIYKELTE
jgi:glycosyltransferase involved in cell wall biosynthesis